ncbi:MAG: hypothetical protein OES84_04030, partial [Kiritimatiellaceae bacterium]|nr:hypothetical protein [Kiritimatiellaceae bacterium]
YIPYSDSLPEAKGAFANIAPAPENTVSFTSEIEARIQNLESEKRPNLKQLISDMLAFNPRPAYQANDPDRRFGTKIFDLEVRWKQVGNKVTVVDISR